MNRIAALLLALVAPLLITTPAHADDPWEPTVEYPLYRPDGAPADAEAVVQLEAPGRAWGIRRAARAVDAQVPGLTIRTTGTCAANPTAACVRVELGTYDLQRQAEMAGELGLAWRGMCSCAESGARAIYLNRYTGPGGIILREQRESTANHELAHALGLGHHGSDGATGADTATSGTFSAAEIAVLTDWYAVPRYRPTGA